MCKNDRRKRLREEWRLQARNKRVALRQRLEKEYPGVPECVRGDLWNWAWEEGHATGLQEVAMWYHDVANMLEKVVESLS